jgi:hypothetical protein
MPISYLHNSFDDAMLYTKCRVGEISHSGEIAKSKKNRLG